MISKKIFWPVLCAVFAIFLFSIYVIGQKKRQTPVLGSTRTITDMKGRSFDVADPLKRVEIAGCLNAAQSMTTIGQRTGLPSGLGKVSMEQVLDWNTDILVINVKEIS